MAEQGKRQVTPRLARDNQGTVYCQFTLGASCVGTWYGSPFSEPCVKGDIEYAVNQM